jgi:Flp pilus assembly protein TadG
MTDAKGAVACHVGDINAVRGSIGAKGRAPAVTGNQNLLRNFRRDEAGSYTVIFAVLLPVLVGSVGIATDIGLWYKTKQTMQGASDSAAASAAAAYAANTASDLTVQADAVADSYGFVNGVRGVSVAVNRPPTSGSYTTDQNAIEVIIRQPQARLFSAIWGSQQVPVSSRSVAKSYGGVACVLALDPTASGAINAQGSTSVALNACALYSDSNSSSSVNVGGSATISTLSVGVVGGVSGASKITTVQGITTGGSSIPDPYAGASYPSFSGCDAHNYTAKATVTINPGVYCGGISLNAGANVTLSPGVYYIDQGSLSVNGSATLTGTGVTIVFTSSTGNNYATATINGGATVNLTPPTSGPTAGIVLFGDRNMPVGASFKLNGGASQVLVGATYLPKGAVQFAGGNSSANSCAQLVGDTVTFTGNSNFAINCPGTPIKPIGSSAAKLVE